MNPYDRLNSTTNWPRMLCLLATLVVCILALFGSAMP